jgi:hypothetical protein
MKYTIIQGAYRRDLNQTIEEMTKQGWKPQGGVAFNPNDNYFFQAMVKDEPVVVEEEEEPAPTEIEKPEEPTEDDTDLG